MSAIGSLVRDKDHDAMWRVTLPSGELSNMVNWDRARELARCLLMNKRRAEAHP